MLFRNGITVTQSQITVNNCFYDTKVWHTCCIYILIGKIKWILTKYETWFDFFLALFMSGYKWDKSSNVNEVMRAVLNSLFFLRKDFTHTKKTQKRK